jgi:uncharacterized protein YfaP (DUF2135 family)
MYNVQYMKDIFHCIEFDPALVVWLRWYIDKTNVDLHVIKPSNKEINFGNKRGTTGSLLSRDFTQGYGFRSVSCPGVCQSGDL